MGMQNMQNQSMHFVLSTDAKPRLKWTPELHQRFIEATNQLGGPEKATPKSLMRVMGIPGLTLYHLKSHLQKYRLGKSQQLETCSDIKQEDYTEIKSSDGHCSRGICLVDQNQITENLQISQALQMQMEVERKLHEQIEVEKHLEIRIEAQGKYLQSVLKKAQEALAGYNCSPVGIKLTKAELSQLVSIINNACPTSPISELTETRGLSLNYVEGKKDRGTMCSLESSLTSSDSSERNEEKLAIEEIVEFKSSNIVPLELPLMTLHPEEKASNGDSILNNDSNERKRNAATESDDGEHTSKKRCGNKLKKALDLNCSLNFWNNEDGL